jgi:hypothetical protein
MQIYDEQNKNDSFLCPKKLADVDVYQAIARHASDTTERVSKQRKIYERHFVE